MREGQEKRQWRRLRGRVWEGLEHRYGEDPARYPMTPQFLRMLHESDVIEQLGLIPDFIMLSNIVNYAKRHDIPIGPGRGILPNSMVAYALGLTEVDPSKCGLIFERLLNPCWAGPVSVQMDVCAKRKPEILDYIERAYGADKAKACEWSPEKIPSNANGLNISLIASNAVTFKHEVARLVRQKNCQVCDLSSVPLDDQATFDLIRSGETAGVFDLESDAKQDLVKKCAPNSIEDLAVLHALFRPSTMNQADEYIRRRNANEPVLYEHPLLEPILKETFGRIIYQEQLILILTTLAGEEHGDAGFTLSQADYARRMVSNGCPAEILKYMQRFTYGCVRTGTLTESEASLYFTELIGAAPRTFSKAHSIGTALLTYQCAYLKTHFPEEFHCGLEG